MASTRVFLASALLAVSSVACVGGAGSVADGTTGYDSRRGDIERPGLAQDTPPKTSERSAASTDMPAASGGGSAAPSAGGSGGAGGSFACSGSYTCTATVEGKTETATVSLSETEAGCQVNTGEDPFILTDDGKLKVGNAVGGTWSQTGNGFTFTAGTATATCVRK